MSFLWHRYLSVLERRPLLTKCVSSGVIMWAGDLIQQGIEYRAQIKQVGSATSRGKEAASASATSAAPSPLPPRSFSSFYDVPRAVRSTIYGTFAVGPVFHVWFRQLDRWIPGGGVKSVLGKMLIDQAVMAPVFTTFFFCAMGVMEGRSTDYIADKVRTCIGPTLMANYAIFPAAQYVNLRYVPQHLRVLVLNAGGLVYNVILSRQNAAANTQAEKEEGGEGDKKVQVSNPSA